jgi:hypothetical protein
MALMSGAGEAVMREAVLVAVGVGVGVAVIVAALVVALMALRLEVGEDMALAWLVLVGVAKRVAGST